MYTLNIYWVVVSIAQRYTLIKSSIAIGFCSGPPSRMEAGLGVKAQKDHFRRLPDCCPTSLVFKVDSFFNRSGDGSAGLA